MRSVVQRFMCSRFVLFPTGPGPMTMTIAVANAFYDSSAFLKWQEEQLQLEALDKHSTWQMHRRKLKVLNPA